jgi:hypothetical protein
MCLPDFGCQRDAQSRELFLRIESACAQNTAADCRVDLSELVTDVEWDRIAFVRMQAWADHPAEHLGVNELKVNEFEDVIVFAKGQTVTRTIRRQYQPEVAYRSTVFLADEAFDGNFGTYARTEAKFSVKSVGSALAANFELLPIN